MIPIGRLVEKDAIGTIVYDHEGTTRIVALEKRGKQPIYRVQLRSGNFVEAAGGHQAWTSRAQGRGGRWSIVDEAEEGARLSVHIRRPSQLGKRLHVGECALAGWLLSDGFVGEYDNSTCTSLIVEFETINDAERQWIEKHNETVFPDVSYNTIAEETESEIVDFIRYRAYGERFRPFVETYGLAGRGTDARVPEQLFEADLDATRAFLRSVFEADGHVMLRKGKSKLIGYQRISRPFVEGVQKLLLRHGIFSRVKRKREKRKNRHDGWCLTMGIQSEVERFAREIDFISPRKRALLRRAIARGGKTAKNVQYDSVVSVEMVGVEEAYGIQTESGEYLSGNIRMHDSSAVASET